MMLRSALLGCSALAVAAMSAAAQQAKLPTGFVPRVNPLIGDIEMQDGKQWVPIGIVDPVGHKFVPSGQAAIGATASAAIPKCSIDSEPVTANNGAGASTTQGVAAWVAQNAASAAQALGVAQGAVPSAGGTMTGPLSLSNTRIVTGISASSLDNHQTAGNFEEVYNYSGQVAYGHRLNYYSYATGPNGFDIAFGPIMIDRATNPNGTQSLTLWPVHVCYNTMTSGYGCFGEEMNVVNRGVDGGWGSVRAQFNQWTGGHQFVPESQTFGEPGTGRNVLFGYLAASSGAKNADGKYAKTYNTFIAEQNSVAPGGRAFFAGGDTLDLAGDLPYAPFEAQNTWLHGLTTTSAAIQDGYALLMSQAQSVGWTDGTNFAGVGVSGTGATAAPVMRANRGSQIQAGTQAGADTPVVITGGKSSAANAGISVGSNISLVFSTNNSIYLTPGGVKALSLNNGSATFGVPVRLQAYTVANLPACNGGVQDAMAVAIDAMSPTYRGALTGGGSVRTPVYCDGSTWSAH